MLRKIHGRLCEDYKPWWKAMDAQEEYHSAERDASDKDVDSQEYADGRQKYLKVTGRKPPAQAKLGPTLAVLAGGRGERMGQPKGMLKVGDKPILEYLLTRFAWLGPTLLVTSPGREDPPAADAFDLEVADPVEGMGPMRGLLTTLENTSTPLVLVTSVDMPLVGGEQLVWLMKKIEEHPEAAVIMIEHNGRIEPFPAVFRQEAKQAIETELKTGKGSLQALAKSPGFIVLPAPPQWSDDIWTNLNEPADLAAFEQRMT